MERSITRERLTITSICPRCGRIEVPVRNIHLWINEAGENTFSYVCPHCCGFVRQSADRGTVSLLLAAAPPITHDDVHGFVKELNEEGWDRRFERLAARGEIPCGRATWRRPLRGLARIVGRAVRATSHRHRMLAS
jgi:Zn ribbon nucleic-acid-binding protein